MEKNNRDIIKNEKSQNLVHTFFPSSYGSCAYAHTFHLWRLCEAPITVVPNGNDAPSISNFSSSVINHSASTSATIPTIRSHPWCHLWNMEDLVPPNNNQAAAKKALQREPRKQERESGNSVSFLKSVRLLMFCLAQKIQNH
jgi:hypothetical protein